MEEEQLATQLGRNGVRASLAADWASEWDGQDGTRRMEAGDERYESEANTNGFGFNDEWEAMELREGRVPTPTQPYPVQQRRGAA